MEILQTHPEHADFQNFTALPALLYPAESPRFRLPDFLPTEWLKACFVMQIEGQPQARAAIYENPAMRTPEGGKIFCLGAFESSQTPATATHFLPFLQQWAKAQGADYLVGQMNGSTWEQYRFAVGEDYTPFFLEHYQHLYYNTLFEQAGFQVIERYFSSIDTELRHNAPAVLEQARKFEEIGVRIRPIDAERYEEELLRLYAFNQLAYQTNYLFSPISQEAFLRKYLPLRSLLRPELVLLAEDADKNLFFKSTLKHINNDEINMYNCGIRFGEVLNYPLRALLISPDISSDETSLEDA